MKTTDTNQTIYWLLMRVMFHAKHRMQQVAEEYDLSVMQSHALTTLKDDEPLAMNVLSNYFMCDASNITGIVDRLESHGLVERRDNPKDRRVKMIGITKKGLELQAKLIDETIRIEHVRLDPALTTEERATLRTILQKILAANTDK